MNKKIMLTVVILMFAFSNLYGQVKCDISEGEAIINKNDTVSAKAEAIARAKWNAIENIVGVEVKAQSVVQNMALVDDAVSKEIKGVVQSYKVLGEEKRDNIYWVKINACVETKKAQSALSNLALNNSIAVFIPAKQPKLVSERENITRGKKQYEMETKEEFEETNILTEKLIGELTEQGFTVIDVAPMEIADASKIEDAIRSGNYLSLRSMIYKLLTNVMIIGKIDYSISTKKGQDAGYGISMPYNNVTVRLQYRIITKEQNSEKILVLASGNEEAKGLAPNVEDATAKAMNSLAEKLIPKIIDKLRDFIKNSARKVNVKVTNVSDINQNFELKDKIQNTAWVLDVKEKELGEFIVTYSENPIYLANSLVQKGFELIKYSTGSIQLKYNFE